MQHFVQQKFKQKNHKRRSCFGQYDYRSSPLLNLGDVLAVKPNCSQEVDGLGVSPLDIARAYDVDCASILEYGPQKWSADCQRKEMANEIFENAFRRMQAITLPRKKA